MELGTILSTLGMDAARTGLKGALRALRGRHSVKEYKILLSTAICELLKENPDVSLAEANILAAEATGVQPSLAFLRTKDMLHKVKRYRAKKAKKKVAKKAAKKKVAKKKVAKKKMAK